MLQIDVLIRKNAVQAQHLCTVTYTPDQALCHTVLLSKTQGCHGFLRWRLYVSLAPRGRPRLRLIGQCSQVSSILSTFFSRHVSQVPSARDAASSAGVQYGMLVHTQVRLSQMCRMAVVVTL